MTHRQIIDQLKEFDFAEDNRDYVHQKLKDLGKFGVLLTTLHKGKRIIRARLSEKESFKNISDLSFKPQEYNSTYQRASTPYKTMFYGSIVPEIQGNSEPQTARITILFELSEFVRNTNTKGEQDITYSAWEVVEDIELISLIHHQDFERPTELTKKLRLDFEGFISQYPELKTPSLEISEYLAHEYAKDKIPDHLHYMISGIYSEIGSSKYDGVLYPSVRLAGEGINVAIKPDTVINKLKFLGASECTVYKNEKDVFVGNNTKSRLDNKNELVFTKMEEKYYVSKEIGRQQVGLNIENDS